MNQINLAPKFKHSLRLWNPLDYVRLLYWLFFFPQAVWKYVDTFGATSSHHDRPRKIIQIKGVPGSLLLQAALLPIIASLSLGLLLQLMGVTIRWVPLPLVSGMTFIPLPLGTGMEVMESQVSCRVAIAGNIAYDEGYISVLYSVAYSGWKVGNAILGCVAEGDLPSLLYVSLHIGLLALCISVFAAIFGTIVFQDIVSGMTFGAALGVLFSVTWLFVTVFGGVAEPNHLIVRVVFAIAFGIVLNIVLVPQPRLGSSRIRMLIIILSSGVSSNLFLNVHRLNFLYALLYCFLWTFTIYIVMILETIYRLEDWLIAVVINLVSPRKDWGFIPRATCLSVPYLDTRLERSLHQNWDSTLPAIEHLFAYSLQWTPAIKALDRALAKLPLNQLIHRVAQLAELTNDGNIVGLIGMRLRYGTKQWLHPIPTLSYTQMSAPGWQALSAAIFNSGSARLGSHPQRSLKSQLDLLFASGNSAYSGLHQTLTQLESPARIAAAGFWALTQSHPDVSVVAFTAIRSLPHGAEMLALAERLTAFQSATELTAIAVLDCPDPPASPLRIETWRAIDRFDRVIEDVKAMRRSFSQAVRSLALNRALGELQRILHDRTTLPIVERDLLVAIAKTWQTALLEIAGEVGKITIAKPVHNPYTVGDPVVGERFIGREDVVSQLEELWLSGQSLQSIVLYGHRRMGKTSILINATQALDSRVQVAYVNLLCLGSIQGVAEVLMAIGDAIAEVVQVTPPTDAELLALPYRTFERYLKQVTGTYTGLSFPKGLIVALDEFEKIEELIEAGKIPADFMGFLRGLVQMSPHIALAFTGLHTLEEMTADYFQPFFASVIPIPVRFLSRAATRQILANPVGESVTADFPLDYTPDALDRIYALTHGQPYLVQLVGFQLVRRYNRQRFEQMGDRDTVFTVEDVDSAIGQPEFFQQGRYYFNGVWGQAARCPTGQQMILQTLATYPEGLKRSSLEAATQCEPQQLLEALSTLTSHDVIEEKQGNWCIAIELFRLWLVEFAQY